MLCCLQLQHLLQDSSFSSRRDHTKQHLDRMEKLFSEVQVQQSQVRLFYLAYLSYSITSAEQTQIKSSHVSAATCPPVCAFAALCTCCIMQTTIMPNDTQQSLVPQAVNQASQLQCCCIYKFSPYDAVLLLLQVLGVSRPRSTSHRASTRRATEPDMSLTMHTASNESAVPAVPTQHSRLQSAQSGFRLVSHETPGSIAAGSVLEEAEHVHQIEVKVQRSLTWAEGETVDFDQSGAICD